MKKLYRGMMALLLCVMTMIATLSGAVSAAAETLCVTENGIVDFGRGEATITISGNNASQSLVGKKFHLYQLFYTENAAGMESINYTFTDTCKAALQNVVGARLNKIATEVTEYEVIDYIQSLNTNKIEGANAVQKEEGYYSDFRYFVEDVRDELVNLSVNAADVVYVADVNASGSVVLQGLEYGYYIIDEVTENAGTNSASSLCIVDTANPDSAVKVKSDYPSIIKKIQEDDNQDEIGNEGWNDMADYEIGQKISYKFTSTVSDMNGYETYFYAWHDIMDDALTFDPDSVHITISKESKEYELAANEFLVKENVNGETFVIQISDLKKIVDTQFDKKDSLAHNTYGQTVTVTYSATLNDLAAENTGLPGFHNDVRLEFSNDPDNAGAGKTGFTPWDSVVCFTYRLNGLKVNNHNKVLANAKFKLYFDEKCTDEVYVKKTDAGYIVMNDDTIDKKVLANAVTIVSDENGEFPIIGLDSGTYYLKEIEAPDGYRTLLEPIKIDIKANFVSDRNNYVKGDSEKQKALQELEYSVHIKEFLDSILNENTTELVTDLDTGSGNLTVVNTVGTKLPITGSSATILMIGIGLALMTVSYGVSRKKKTHVQ